MVGVGCDRSTGVKSKCRLQRNSACCAKEATMIPFLGTRRLSVSILLLLLVVALVYAPVLSRHASRRTRHLQQHPATSHAVRHDPGFRLCFRHFHLACRLFEVWRFGDLDWPRSGRGSVQYSVTGSPQALDNVGRALLGIRSLLDVTGTEVLARCLVPVGSPYHDSILASEAHHLSSTGEVGGQPYSWIGDTTRDQYSGVMLGLSVGD